MRTPDRIARRARIQDDGTKDVSIIKQRYEAAAKEFLVLKQGIEGKSS
jgi:hypothetical protein